jgi:hypothetical protein
MVSKPTGRRRGRPSWDWRTWPHRYAIVVADALQALGKSEREATDLAVSLFYSWELAVDSSQRTVTYELRSEPGAPASIKGRASTIRQKANRLPLSAAFAEWRITMARAIMIAFKPGKDKYACGLAILELARLADRLRNDADNPIGDQTFALYRLLPLIEREAVSPDFNTSDK